MRREEKFTDKKSLKISSLQTDYLNIDSSSGFGRDSERAHAVQTECKFCRVVNHSKDFFFKRIRKEKEKSRTVDVSSKRNMERTPREYLGCESEDHRIAKCPKEVCLNEKGNYIMVRMKTDTEHLCKKGDRVQE